MWSHSAPAKWVLCWCVPLLKVLNFQFTSPNNYWSMNISPPTLFFTSFSLSIVAFILSVILLASQKPVVLQDWLSFFSYNSLEKLGTSLFSMFLEVMSITGASGVSCAAPVPEPPFCCGNQLFTLSCWELSPRRWTVHSMSGCWVAWKVFLKCKLTLSSRHYSATPVSKTPSTTETSFYYIYSGWLLKINEVHLILIFLNYLFRGCCKAGLYVAR